jgi:hypothetical protein
MVRAIFVLVNTVVSPFASFAATHRRRLVKLVNYSRSFAVPRLSQNHVFMNEVKGAAPQ